MGDAANSVGMWIACSFMLIVILTQSVLYFKLGRRRAKELGISAETQKQSIRAAAITAIGPSLSMVIVLLSLVIVVGSPLAWMRLNDIGAARTELSVVSIVKNLIPATADPTQSLSYYSWGMALNNMGWMLVALILTPRMGWAVEKMNSKFDPKLVKAVMMGASIGLFAFLLANNTVGKATPYWIGALAAGISIILINRLFRTNQRLLELSLGIAMIIGMIAASIAASVMGVK